MAWIHDSATTDSLLSLIPSTNERIRELHDSLWNESDADPVILELCRIRMAQLIGSPADLAVRYQPALADGLGDDRLETLGEWPISDLFDERDRAALNFAEKYVIDAHSITDADCARMNEHFNPEQIAALTTGLAMFDAMARFRVALSAMVPDEPKVAPTPTTPLP